MLSWKRNAEPQQKFTVWRKNLQQVNSPLTWYKDFYVIRNLEQGSQASTVYWIAAVQ